MPMEEYKIFNMQVAKLEGFEFLLQVTIFLLKLTPLALKHRTKRSTLFRQLSPSEMESTRIREAVFVFHLN